MIQTFTFAGALDIEVFQGAFQAVVDHTDALRTVIEEVDGTPQQCVLPEQNYHVEFVDFSKAANPAAAYAQWLDTRRLTLFDLRARLFDSVLVTLAPEHFVWYLS
jgi:hypothetical protein